MEEAASGSAEREREEALCIIIGKVSFLLETEARLHLRKRTDSVRNHRSVTTMTRGEPEGIGHSRAQPHALPTARI